MFDLKGYTAAIKRHWALFALTQFLVVVFASAPFLMLWRAAKRAPVVGDVLRKIPGAAA